MAPPSSAASVALRVDDDLDATSTSVADAADVVRDLQARIRGMQRTKLDTRALPTHPALGELLPGGALEAGSSYAVLDSTTLALGLLQGPSAAGAWCAVVGVPDLGSKPRPGWGSTWSGWSWSRIRVSSGCPWSRRSSMWSRSCS